MTADQLDNDNGYGYFLSRQKNDWYIWIVASLILHMGVFSLTWIYTRLQLWDTPVIRHAIMVEPVAWAPEERPKHWLPVKNTVKRGKLEEEKIKVTRETEKAATPDPKKEEEKLREDDAAKKRREAMEKALAKIAKGQATRLDGRPDGVVGAPSSRSMGILSNAYAMLLRELFRKQWEVPGIIPAEELKRLSCRILIRIDMAGNVISQNVEESSGNRMFDSSAMRAVKMTRTVPLPDDMIKDVVMKQGILVNFTRKD